MSLYSSISISLSLHLPCPLLLCQFNSNRFCFIGMATTYLHFSSQQKNKHWQSNNKTHNVIKSNFPHSCLKLCPSLSLFFLSFSASLCQTLHTHPLSRSPSPHLRFPPPPSSWFLLPAFRCTRCLPLCSSISLSLSLSSSLPRSLSLKFKLKISFIGT